MIHEILEYRSKFNEEIDKESIISFLKKLEKESGKKLTYNFESSDYILTGKGKKLDSYRILIIGSIKFSFSLDFLEGQLYRLAFYTNGFLSVQSDNYIYLGDKTLNDVEAILIRFVKLKKIPKSKEFVYIEESYKNGFNLLTEDAPLKKPITKDDIIPFIDNDSISKFVDRYKDEDGYPSNSIMKLINMVNQVGNLNNTPYGWWPAITKEYTNYCIKKLGYIEGTKDIRGFDTVRKVIRNAILYAAGNVNRKEVKDILIKQDSAEKPIINTKVYSDYIEELYKSKDALTAKEVDEKIFEKMASVTRGPKNLFILTGAGGFGKTESLNKFIAKIGGIKKDYSELTWRDTERTFIKVEKQKVEGAYWMLRPKKPERSNKIVVEYSTENWDDPVKTLTIAMEKTNGRILIFDDNPEIFNKDLLDYIKKACAPGNVPRKVGLPDEITIEKDMVKNITYKMPGTVNYLGKIFVLTNRSLKEMKDLLKANTPKDWGAFLGRAEVIDVDISPEETMLRIRKTIPAILSDKRNALNKAITPALAEEVLTLIYQYTKEAQSEITPKEKPTVSDIEKNPIIKLDFRFFIHSCLKNYLKAKRTRCI